MMNYTVNRGYWIMSEDRCVCCGAVIPEGGHVCIKCLEKAKKQQEEKEDDKPENPFLDWDVKTFG
jgi:hypothetical protein